MGNPPVFEAATFHFPYETIRSRQPPHLRSSSPSRSLARSIDLARGGARIERQSEVREIPPAFPSVPLAAAIRVWIRAAGFESPPPRRSSVAARNLGFLCVPFLLCRSDGSVLDFGDLRVEFGWLNLRLLRVLPGFLRASIDADGANGGFCFVHGRSIMR
ncbi:hypothetical protein NL676_014041 [Syzygium grande]|nr:hypothetical protein NL676_014041 [Syzygium grande]